MLRMQERLNSRLVSTAMQGIHGVFDFSKIDELKQGMDDDVKAATVLFNMGFSRNELNQRFGLGFEEVTSGETQYVPMNLIDVNMEPLAEPEKAISTKPVEKSEKATRATRQSQIFSRKQQRSERMLLGKIKKFFITQRTKVLKGLYQQKDVSTSELIARINVFEAEDTRLISTLTPVFQEIMKDSGQMALDFVNSSVEYEIDREILFNRMNKIKTINKTVFNQIKMEIADGVQAGETLTDISTRIKKVYKFADKRASVIARTESNALMNETSLKVYQQQGVQKREWITRGDSDVRSSHAANAAAGPIAMNKAFPGSHEMYPGENSVGCRCRTLPVVQLDLS